MGVIPFVQNWDSQIRGGRDDHGFNRVLKNPFAL